MSPLPTEPQAPKPQALSVLRSLTSIVDSATELATVVVGNLDTIQALPADLRMRIVGVCDAVYDLDYRTANLGEKPPPGSGGLLG